MKLSSMNSYPIFIILFISVLCTLACNNRGSHQEQNSQRESQAAPPTVTLPEPGVGTNGSRFKLTELAAAEKKIFQINDTIVFTGLEEQMKKQKFLKEVQLRVKLHCIFDTKKVLIKEFTRELQTSIPLIELLSQEALLPQESNYPSCGFSFKAEHKGGAAHHFEIPPLPIVDYDKHRFIQLLDSSGKIKDPFNYIFINELSRYWMDTGEQEPMNDLKLTCSDFSLSLPIRPQQFIPLSAFSFDSLEESIWEKVNKENPVQLCRIFGYKADTLVGVSSVFHLMYPQPSLRVGIDDDLFKNKEPSFYFAIMEPDGKKVKEPRPDFPIYTYSIKNPQPYPVHILIENYKERELYLRYYGLYHREGKSFYSKTEELFSLGSIYTVKGQSAQNKTKMGTVITLEPKSEISFSALITEPFWLCSNSRDGTLTHWLGTVVKFPDLRIYQLLSDQIETIPLSKNIMYELDTQADEHFDILTDYLKKNSREKFRNIFFRKGLCSGTIIAKSKDPIIELYGPKPRLRWIDFTPVYPGHFNNTDSSISKILNNR
ncbi:MAG: hypothetical protein OXM55_07790 [Bdellovibrionales bacterium]|nr:hypothetical protein [Bdellovibrionales bacterium]